MLEVLDSLGLGQYKDNFQKEEINGCLLIDLDEDILEKELNVKSKIHRIRIMRLVTGKQSVIGLLKPKDSTATVTTSPKAISATVDHT